jgi:hypothetical protein
MQRFIRAHRRHFHLGVAAKHNDCKPVALGIVAVLPDRVPHILDHRIPLLRGHAERLIEQVDDGEPLASSLILNVRQREDDQQHHHRAQGERKPPPPTPEPRETAIPQPP